MDGRGTWTITTAPPFFSYATGDPGNRADVLAALTRATGAAPAQQTGITVKAASAPPLPTPDIAARIHRAIRTAPTWRTPGWTLQGFVPAR
jgi:hypothetical protein